MFKRLFLLLFLATATFLAGCGDSNNFDGYYSDNNPYSLSGNTGSVQLTTTIAGINGQSTSVTTSDSVPTEVSEFRFTGFNASGVQIYSAIQPKAATVTLTNVPVEVTSLRIELLVEGLTIGGLSTPVQVQAGQTTTIINPSWVFLDSYANAYGTWAMPTLTVDENEDTESPLETYSVLVTEGEAVDFANQGSTANVTRSAPGVYTVAVDGDYLVNYTYLSLGAIFLGGPVELEFQRLNAQGSKVDSTFFLSFLSNPYTTVVSLKAGESISLNLNKVYAEELDHNYPFIGGSFSIVRIGSYSNSSLPESNELEIPDEPT